MDKHFQCSEEYTHPHRDFIGLKTQTVKKHYETKPNSISLLLKDGTIRYILIRRSHNSSRFRNLSSSPWLAIADAVVDIKIL